MAMCTRCGNRPASDGYRRCDPCRVADRDRRQHARDSRRPQAPPASRLASQTWRDEAACRGMGPDLFYPQSTKSGPGSTLESRLNSDHAVAVYRRCPVTDPCLAYALDHDEEHGVWGATTPEDRQALDRIRQRRPRPDPDQVQR